MQLVPATTLEGKGKVPKKLITNTNIDLRHSNCSNIYHTKSLTRYPNRLIKTTIILRSEWQWITIF